MLFFILLELFFPINLDKADNVSKVITDRDGRYLYTTLNSTQKWRFKANIKDLDPIYIKMLLNYEDKHFFIHNGVDFLALLRATKQLIINGHITSGGSTITMQLAKLLEPKKRDIGSKIVEIFRSYQIEIHYNKEDILNAYLTLAPYGGNIEGVVSASLRYFNKLPNSLTLSEAAILTSLPQNPNINRPNRYPKFTKIARDKVLLRSLNANIITQNEYNRAIKNIIVKKEFTFPRFAPHLSKKILRQSSKIVTQSTIYLPLQDRLQQWAKSVSKSFPKGVTLSIIVANNKSAEIVSYIATQDIFSNKISGYIDMISAIRSPGSTLKPLIYAIGFKKHIIDANTIIKDKNSQFNNYRPHNFDRVFNDEVTITTALQNSLNIPAVKVLEKIGAKEFIYTLQTIAGKVAIPKGKATLPIALGGLGITPLQVTKLYTVLANNGSSKELHYIKKEKVKIVNLLPKDSVIKIIDILRENPPPRGYSNSNGFYAYKTGTSYGYRDFWSIVFSKHYTLTLLIAKPNNQPIFKSSARKVAAPLSFEAIDIVKNTLPHFSWESSSSTTTQSTPPPSLKYLEKKEKEINNFKFLYPKNNSRFQSASCYNVSVEFQLVGGVAPFIWYVDGKEIKNQSNNLNLEFTIGAHKISVIDSKAKEIYQDIWVDMPNCKE